MAVDPTLARRYQDLPPATTPLSGTEVIAISQDGVTVQTTTGAIAGGSVTGTPDEVLYFDAIGHITGDSLFVRDPATFQTTIGVALSGTITEMLTIGGIIPNINVPASGILRVDTSTQTNNVIASGDFTGVGLGLNTSIMGYFDGTNNNAIFIASNPSGNPLASMQTQDTSNNSGEIDVSPQQINIRLNTSGSGALGGFVIQENILQIYNDHTNWSWPTVDGTVGQVIGTDGSGHLGWYNAGGGLPGGTDYQTLTLDGSNAPVFVNQLADITGAGSLNYFSRQLYDAFSNVKVDWSASQLSLGALVKVDWSASRLYDDAGLPSVWWEGRIAQGADGYSLDWGGRGLQLANATIVLDWGQQELIDNNGHLALHWTNRQLVDVSNFQSIDWQSRIMYDSGAQTAVNWQNRTLSDSGSNIVADWHTNNRIRLGDTSGSNRHTTLDVNDNSSSVTIKGIYVAYGAITFTGSGANDLTINGAYSGTTTTNWTLTIDAVNNYNLTMTGDSGTPPSPGDSFTTSGGASGVILAWDGVSVLEVGNLVGTVAPADVVTDTNTGWTASVIGGGQTNDTFSWTNGITSAQHAPCTTGTGMTQNIVADFAGAVGHTLGDHWDFTITAHQGQLLLADFINGQIQLGDSTVVNNGTVMNVDDTNQRFSFNKRNFLIDAVPYQFPAIQGGAGTALTNDGSGNLSWTLNSSLGWTYDAVNANLYVPVAGSGSALTTGHNNEFAGIAAGAHVTTGYENSFYGFHSGTSVTSAFGNTGLGNYTLQNLVDGNTNLAFGSFSGAGIVHSSGSIAIGNNALLNGDGNSNTIIGHHAGENLTNGSGNIFIGNSVGFSTLTSSSNNTFIGVNANATSNVNGSISLGKDTIVTASNQLMIGSNATFISDICINGDASATPIAATLRVSNGLGSNVAGAGLELRAGRGTGSASGGNIIFRTSIAGTSGSSLNAASIWQTIQPDGIVTLGDHDTAQNGTLVTINDLNKLITMAVDGPMSVSDVAGNKYIEVRADISRVQVGDVNGHVNGTVLTVDPALSSVSIQGGLILNTSFTSGNFTASPFIYYYDIDTTAGASVVTLPLSNTIPSGQTWVFSDLYGHATANNITITCSGGDTINGLSSFVINQNYGSLTLHSNNSNKYIAS